MRVGLRGPQPGLIDRAEVVEALASAGWVVTHAAATLGVTKPTLYAAMKRLRIKRRPVAPDVLSEMQSWRASAERPKRRKRAQPAA